MANEKGEQESFRYGNISLILDGYDDIFSDFDPREFSERALSDDFLNECRRAVRDKRDGEVLSIELLVPKAKRDVNDEAKIKARLKRHFEKHFEEKQREIKSIRVKGALWFLLGVIFIFGAAFFYKKEGFFFNLLFVMLEPAGWFTFWTGLERTLVKTEEKKPELEFYKKMAHLDIRFFSY